MIVDAILIATPAALERVCGITLAKRNVLTLARAGVTRVVVAGDDAVARALAGDRDVGKARVAIDSAQTAEDAQRAIAKAAVALRSDRLYEPGAVKRAVASGQVAAGQIAAGRIDVEAWHDASTPEARRGAERLLYRSLRKPVDGFIARNVNRHVSLAVTRLIIGTGITPNMMTVVANAVGALGVWFVAQATWTSIAIGAFLVQMQSILDGCDGELARLKFKSSRFGEWFDNVLDDSVNVAFGAALGHATSVLTGQTIWWWLGLGAAAGFTLYNVMVYLQLALVHKTGNPFAFRWWFQKGEADLAATLARPGAANRLAELSRAIARRDVFLFCYMLLAFVRLPQVAVGWYAAIASVTVVTSLMHVMMGGMRRPNAPATQEQHVERKVEAR